MYFHSFFSAYATPRQDFLTFSLSGSLPLWRRQEAKWTTRDWLGMGEQRSGVSIDLEHGEENIE